LLDEISITGIHFNVNYTLNYKLLISTSDVQLYLIHVISTT